jgi:hypothetical protein
MTGRPLDKRGWAGSGVVGRAGAVLWLYLQGKETAGHLDKHGIDGAVDGGASCMSARRASLGSARGRGRTTTRTGWLLDALLLRVLRLHTAFPWAMTKVHTNASRNGGSWGGVAAVGVESNDGECGMAWDGEVILVFDLFPFPPPTPQT